MSKRSSVVAGLGGASALVATVLLMSSTPIACGCEELWVEVAAIANVQDASTIDDLTVEKLRVGLSRRFVGKVVSPDSLQLSNSKRRSCSAAPSSKDPLQCIWYLERSWFRESGYRVSLARGDDGIVRDVVVSEAMRTGE
jgi:hypothetical protein